MLASHTLALAGVPLHRVIRLVREIRDNRYTLLRGYFHGSNEDITERASEVLLKSFSLPLTSGAVGARLSDLGLEALGVEVSSVRRGRERVLVNDNLVFESADTLVMRGTSEALALAEERLSDPSRIK